MASVTISELRDAIKDIEQGRVVRGKSTTLPYIDSRAQNCRKQKTFRNVELPTTDDTRKVVRHDADNQMDLVHEKDLSEDAAFKRIIKLVSVRDRCAAELKDRLQREEFPLPVIEEAIERAQRVQIVDDVRFAEQFVRGRISSGKGSAGIERDLAKYGISVYDIPGWPYEYISEDDEFDRALNFLKTHPPRSKNPRESAYRKLIQKGYTSDIAASVARSWLENSMK